MELTIVNLIVVLGDSHIVQNSTDSIDWSDLNYS
jgi:hypothetical protein